MQLRVPASADNIMAWQVLRSRRISLSRSLRGTLLWGRRCWVEGQACWAVCCWARLLRTDMERADGVEAAVGAAAAVAGAAGRT